MSAPAAKISGRTRLPPEERRAQLLALALDVVAERGLGETRQAEVARRAGVAVSTVFVYFPTREALVDAVVDEVARAFLEGVGRRLAQDLPAPLLLRDLSAAFLDTLGTRRSYVVVLLKWGSAVDERVWPRYRDFTEAYVARVRGALERGQQEGDVSAAADAESLARLFAASALSVARLELSGVERETVLRFQETVLRAIFLPSALERAASGSASTPETA
jgi:TetR/AcrR family hemagglutinin/protease transcriptional regulator